MSNRAWVTLATNDSYGLGALVLAHSLRRAGSEHPAVVLITPAVTDAMRERLNAVFAGMVTVDVLDSRDAAHLALLQRPELGVTFTKIHCWSLTQYEKCVFLDADTLVVQNCDELFEREELSAAPDVGWPDCFNSGVFVFRPSTETFDRLIAFAQERGSFDGGDQGLLNSFFSDWARGDISKHLPFLYNVTSAAFYSYLPALKHYGQDLKIIHFIGPAKPWLQHFNFESRTVDAPDHIRGLLQLWWDIFVGQVHSQLDTAMVEVDEPSPETPPPALPPHDVNQHYHYQPVLDPESEFPWHRPDAQIVDENAETNVDIQDIHDPWEIYRGNIPPMSEDTHSEVAEIREEIRQYAWDYQHQETIVQQRRSPDYLGCPPSSHTHHIHQHSDYQESDHNSHHDYNHQQQNSSSCHDLGQWNNDATDHFYEDLDHHQDINHHHQDVTHHQDVNHHHQHHYEQNNLQHNQPHDTQYQVQSSQPYDAHLNDCNCSHDSFNQPSVSLGNDHYDLDKTQEHNFQPHDNYHHIVNTNKPLDIPTQNEVVVNHVHLNTKHNRRPRRHRIDLGSEMNGLTNGDISQSESEYFEDVIPRHPYDGFYLRHRVTIDARGRKVCTHEIPPTPSPTPSPPLSPTPQDYDTAEENPSDTEDQSGVAGNLARVVPGASHEALDDLTRRQGWEAGNIDYMGADSFDKIWAKISQTLTKPRSSPSPPKESPPAVLPVEVPVQSVELAKEVSEPVEVAKEAVVDAPAPVTPEVPKPVAPVSAPATESVPTPVEEPAAPKVGPTPVAAPVEKTAVAPVETPIVPTEPAALDDIPVTVAAPVEKTAVAPVETPIVPTEAAALDDIPVTVAAHESLSLETPEKTKKTESKEKNESEAPKVLEMSKPESLAAQASAASEALEATPEKLGKAPVATDSPPLANTPSKEEAPAIPAAKSEERRKVGKLQLSAPARAPADALPTPDSEAEDAAALAHSIIASELRAGAVRTPTVSAPTTPAAPPSPPLASAAGLTVDEPQVPTPPVGPISLAQIGVKPKEKTTTAAQLESSIAAAEKAPADAAPKKKLVKKLVKKEGAAGDAPVPPPRKKEKKPKEK